MSEAQRNADGGIRADAGPTIRVLHFSDIHCGRSFVEQQVEATAEFAARSPLNAIVISGDFSQRARPHEFQQAAHIVDRFRRIAPTLIVPGNHDTAWWHAPFGFGDATKLHRDYRTYLSDDLEPTLRLPGLSIVGLNSAQGLLPQTATWYPRDWRVKGGLTPAQLTSAATRLNASPATDLKILVCHHNIVRGRLSNRWGLKRPRAALNAIAAMHPHVVCTGHDHEERVELVTNPLGSFIVSAANTLSRRVRGHRATAINLIEGTPHNVVVTAWPYRSGKFVPGPMTATLAR